MKLQGRIADHQYGLSGLILQLGLAGEQREGLGTFLLLDGHQFAFSGERVARANPRTHIEAHAAGRRPDAPPATTSRDSPPSGHRGDPRRTSALMNLTISAAPAPSCPASATPRANASSSSTSSCTMPSSSARGASTVSPVNSRRRA